MQPEYAVPPVDVALLGTNASATSDHLASATATMLREDPDTHERWQTWRADMARPWRKSRSRDGADDETRFHRNLPGGVGVAGLPAALMNARGGRADR
jgi:hypothetical protein